MRAAGERIVPALAALAVCFCALFFAGGLADAPLVWIGGLALVTAAVSLVWSTPAGTAAAVYLGCLWGLAVWCGLSILWSASPDESWSFTNRTLAYAAFATLGVLVGAGSVGGKAAGARPESLGAFGAPGPRSEQVAAAASAVVAAVVGWALLAKCVPALYPDYGRLARLRAPLVDWNMLALVCVAGVALALWSAARSRVAGAVFLYLAAVALLLTYSRFGVALACAAALAWIALAPDRVETLATLAAGGGVAVAVFAVALGLDGITSDHVARGVRDHDGWIFALVVLAGAAAVAVAGAGIARLRIAPERRHAVERAAAGLAVVAAVAGLAVTIAKAHTIWHEFTNPVAGQTVYGPARLGQAGSGNRWTWWDEAWRGFTGRPLGGTGAGTWQFTDLRLRTSSDVTALEPHNTPLQFLSETGIVGFLLYAGAMAAALRRFRGVLGVLFAAFVVHSIINYDWSFAAVCGPFLFVGGVLAAGARDRATARSPLVAAAAVVFALGCVYSLAAPWLAQRAQASATTLAGVDRAHSYDPLNAQILVERAAFQAPRGAERSYRDALALEPANSTLWFDLATFYADNDDWEDAYKALSRAYRYDPFGPAGQCGIAAKIRRHVGIKVTCRGAG